MNKLARQLDLQIWAINQLGSNSVANSATSEASCLSITFAEVAGNMI